MFSVGLDKNKAAYKLDGLPPVIWLNLDADTHRREYMEAMFDRWNVTDHTRIAGFDGRQGDVTEHLKGVVPEHLSPGEIGCCMSHIKALQYFVEETDYDRVLIMEDDIDLEYARFWNFTWKEMVSYLPYDYDTVQFTIINPATVHVNLHPRFINDFSAACYLITRHHAEKVLKAHVRGKRYKLDNGVLPRATSEDVVLYSGKGYAFPILNFRLDLGSAIHDEHIDIFHRNSWQGINEFWTTNGSTYPLEQLMRYQPYEYYLPPGFDANGKIPRADEQPAQGG